MLLVFIRKPTASLIVVKMVQQTLLDLRWRRASLTSGLETLVARLFLEAMIVMTLILVCFRGNFWVLKLIIFVVDSRLPLLGIYINRDGIERCARIGDTHSLNNR